MSSPTDKGALLAQLRTRLERELLVLEQAQKTTVAGATHEEAKPENDKDTRALEQSYLARGQAERVEQLRSDVGLLQSLKLRDFSDDDPVALGALIRLADEDGVEQLVLLVPAGAGESLESPLGEVRTITPRSPLGKALLGARLGDDVELRSPSMTRTLTLASVR